MNDFNTSCIRRIEFIGRAHEKLSALLNDDVFQDTSKHNPYWDSEHELESDKLYDLRMKISFMQARLWDILALLDGEHE